MKIKKHKKISIYKIFVLISIIIFFLSIYFFMKFNKLVTPKLYNIAVLNIKKLNETILMNYKVKDIYKEVNLEDCIKITKNKKDEILTVDFNLEQAYEVLSMITEYIDKSIKDINIRKEVLNNYNEELSNNLNSIILSLPVGLSSDYIYLVNLGPKIPVKVSFLGYISSSVRIKLEEYGINNTLISIYIDCFISNEFILPFNKEIITNEYNILISSKIIQGIVPSYFGGTIERKSNILTLPIT